jgi:hypothetical protein
MKRRGVRVIRRATFVFQSAAAHRPLTSPLLFRPAIDLPGVVNPASLQAVAGTSRSRPQSKVTDIWRRVVEQVFHQGLGLANTLELPAAAVETEVRPAVTKVKRRC